MYNNVTYGNELNSTERYVLAILKENSEISRDEIASKISKTIRTVQRALVSLTEKGYNLGCNKVGQTEENLMESVCISRH